MTVKILLTGMSGVGKSTIIHEMKKRGILAIDTDEPGWIILRSDGERIWHEERMSSLLSINENLVVSGTVINQAKFYPLFDKIVLLTAPKSVIKERLQTRTNNPYGKDPREMKEALGYIETVQPLLRKSSDVVINTDQPIEDVTKQIIELFD